MSHSHETIASRIVKIVQLKPMTVKQIADVLCSSDDNVRVTMQRLEQTGKIRRAGFERSERRSGTTPYLWVAA